MHPRLGLVLAGGTGRHERRVQSPRRLIIAALCFGASERVDQVCVRIDSIGLEEAVAEQDSAISDLMSAALRSFERLHTGDAGASKADPKGR